MPHSATRKSWPIALFIPFLSVPLFAGTLPFSSPRLLTTLPWASGARPGVPRAGAGWLVVDDRGRYWVETDRDLGLYSPQGRWLATASPMDKRKNFYGFAAMAPRPGGGLAMLEQLETPFEREEKFNVELRSKPGSRLILLDKNGRVESAQEEVDPAEPHSVYDLENGILVSLHPDGTYLKLDSLGPGAPEDKGLKVFAALADPAHWNKHVRTLPVFHSTDHYYHDIFGHPHADKGANLFLMGVPFVEGTGPLGERQGRVYYRVVCAPRDGLTEAVFVEDPARRAYSLIELVPADEALNTAQDHALFLDAKGDLYEGVAKQDGYRIYGWKALN